MIFNIINNIRLICIKTINNAKSGHPGVALGIADFFVILWNFIYKNIFFYNSINKDKIILSNGHGSIIQYVMLYYNRIYNLNDLIKFRKIFSKTPGHPEIGKIIDASTGPLGQGIGIGIGLGLKNKILSNKFNKNIEIFNKKIWIVCGDGCLMEGISDECCSFCGSYNINNIILLYDSNNISIDGIINNYFIDNLKIKFISMNWDVIGPINGHCFKSIFKSFVLAKKNFFPVLIIFKTIIGFLSPCKSYSETVHGNIFNSYEYKLILKNYTINFFFIKKIFFDNKKKYFLKYINKNKNLFLELIRLINNIRININIINIYINNYIICLNKSTRFISSIVLSKIYLLNEIIGGSADLTSSNLTKNNLINSISKKNFKNRFINYGVREFCMGLISYGLSSNNIIKTFTSTFLVFSNYMYSAIRNSCLSKLSNIFIFTHDSISVGEDGPSHQPIEQLQSIRIIPRIYVFRPYNFIEVIISWVFSLKLKKNCSSIILSRQNFKNNENFFFNVKNIIKGGYLFLQKKKIDLLIISSGSDIELSLKVVFFLKKYFNIEILSIYCNKLFDKQFKIYKKKIFSCKKILVIESSNDNIWYKYNSFYFFLLNLNKFGKSGSSEEIKKKYNLTKKFLIKLCLYIIKL